MKRFSIRSITPLILILLLTFCLSGTAFAVDSKDDIPEQFEFLNTVTAPGLPSVEIDSQPAGEITLPERLENSILSNSVTCTTIRLGQTINSSLSTSDPKLSDGSYYELYCFTVSAGQQVTIRMTSSAFKTYVALFKDDNLIADSGGSNDSRIPASGYITLSSAGTYAILANALEPGKTGSFTLSLTGVVPCTTIGIGQTLSGSLTSSDPSTTNGYSADAFCLTVPANQQVAITMTSSSIDPYLILINPGGQKIAENDDGGAGTNARIPADSGYYTLTQAGTYVILATTYNGANGSYSLSVTAPQSSGTVNFSQSTYSVQENGGSAKITVNRSGSTSGTASVSYATSNGSATAGSDYSTTSGTLTFNSGDTSKDFYVTILNDANVEGNETVNLSLSNPSGATLGSPGTAVLTINDDDATPPPTGTTKGPGYVIGGYRYLSNEVAGNSNLLQELNGKIATQGLSTLIVDLSNQECKPFNYQAFMTAGGLSYPGGFSQYAIDHPATLPAGTMIKHANGSTELDPCAQPPLLTNLAALFDGVLMTTLSATVDPSVIKLEVYKGSNMLVDYSGSQIAESFSQSFLGASRGDVLTIKAYTSPSSFSTYTVTVQ